MASAACVGEGVGVGEGTVSVDESSLQRCAPPLSSKNPTDFVAGTTTHSHKLGMWLTISSSPELMAQLDVSSPKQKKTHAA